MTFYRRRPSCLRGVSTTVCRLTELSRRTRLTPGRHLPPWIDLLDEAGSGAFYLRQPPVADMIVEAILYNANILGHYRLHAFVVIPNHVHLLATPAVALPKVTKSLKGRLGDRGSPADQGGPPHAGP